MCLLSPLLSDSRLLSKAEASLLLFVFWVTLAQPLHFSDVAPWICVDWGESGSVFRHSSSRWSWRCIRLPLVNVAPLKRSRGNSDTDLAFNLKALFPSSLFIWLVVVTRGQILLLVTKDASCLCLFLFLSAALRTGPRPKEKRVSWWSLQLHAKKRWVAPCVRACKCVCVFLLLTMQSLLIFHWQGRGLFFHVWPMLYDHAAPSLLFPG